MNIILYNDDFILKKQEIDTINIEEMCQIECKVKIIINDNIFYDDWFNQLEFYLIFKAWHKELIIGERTNLVYNSIDNGKNPILSIIYLKEKDGWTIDSIFKKYEEKKVFSLA